MQVVTRSLLNSGFTGPVKEISRQVYKEFSGPQRWEVFPDVHKTLQQLRSNGVVLGVVSNFDERLGKLVVVSMQFVESGLSMTLNFDHWNNYIDCNPNTPLVKTTIFMQCFY